MAAEEMVSNTSDSKLDLSIQSLTQLYNSGHFSPVAVIREVYARIAAYHDKAVWITLVPEQEAVQRAESLLLQYSDGCDRPPLFGIPFSVKDSIDIAGMPTTLACPALEYTATATATVVERILASGGILIGKTNLDQFATGLNGTRSPYGIPRCVHDPDYISGGSSSGSVVSVAAGLVSFTVATDTAGSTRVPSALNGVIGIKPTLGTISTIGLVPAVKTADCITIIAPDMPTARSALAVMQHYDPKDIYARDPQQLWLLANQPSWPSGTPSQHIRYGIPPASLLTTDILSPTYHTLFHRFLSTLPTLLHNPPSTTFDYTPFAAANAMLYDSTIVSQRLAAIRPLLPAPPPSSPDPKPHDPLSPHLLPIIHQILTDPTTSTHASAEQAWLDIHRLQRHKAAAHREFRCPTPTSTSSADEDEEATTTGIDVLILPTTTCHPTVTEMLADPLNLNKRLGTFTHFVNLLDLCAVAVPVKMKEKVAWRSGNGREMPFGVTLVGMPGREGEVMALGERVAGWEVG